MLNSKIQPLIISITVCSVVTLGPDVFGCVDLARYAFTGQRTASSRPRVKNLKELINKLKTGGERVARKGKVEQPFFSVKGQVITIGDQDVQVFEYRTIKDAELDARKVSNTGSSAGMSMPMWIAPPHFFRNSKLIVLYVGENPSVLKALEDVLGPQFAGR